MTKLDNRPHDPRPLGAVARCAIALAGAGFVVVPVHSTREVIEVGMAPIDDVLDEDSPPTTAAYATAVWQSTLAAATGLRR